MNISDYLLLGGIACAVLAAVQHMRKHKGGCCKDCSHCSKDSCQNREDCQHETDKR